MASSVFGFLSNCTLTFSAPTAATTTDRSGNEVPVEKEVSIKAYLKPEARFKAPEPIRTQFPLEVTATYMAGYVTSSGGLPAGIQPGARASMTYKGSLLGSSKERKGEFLCYLRLQSSVGADSITGEAIEGVFILNGGK